jgi:hypothetical protein
MGAGRTNSTHAAELKRSLDADLALRESIYADGQTPESFRIERGVSSGRGVNEAAGRNSDDLRADLYREGGASEEDIRWDRLHRRR